MCCYDVSLSNKSLLYSSKVESFHNFRNYMVMHYENLIYENFVLFIFNSMHDS